MPVGIIQPVYAIVAQPADYLKREYKVGANATAAKMLPGRVVMYDTVDYAVKEAGDAQRDYLGIIDVTSGKLRTDNYAVGDPVPIIEGECDCLVLLASGGGALTPGDGVACAADGKVRLLATDEAPLGHSLETVSDAVDAWVLIHYNPQKHAAGA